MCVFEKVWLMLSFTDNYHFPSFYYTHEPTLYNWTILDSLFMALFHCMVRYGSARLVTVRLSSGRFAFPLHGMVRYGSVRVDLRFHCIFLPLLSGRDYSRVVTVALPWHHRKRTTNKLTTKKGDGVFFILGMWMFLTAMERSMRTLVIYPQQQRLWCSDTGCRGGEQVCCVTWLVN